MWRRVLRLRRTFRNLARLRQIGAVLIRYGLSDLLHDLGLGFVMRRAWHWLRLRFDPLPRTRSDRPRSLRLALQELGPAFIKLGQVLSTRPDILPPAYIRELQRLQDDVTPMSFETVREVLAEEELEEAIREHVDSIEEEALAAASVAQVHRARLRDGREVVMKIQRPDAEWFFHRDLDVLLDIARFLEREDEFRERFEPVRMVHEVRRSMRRELDFLFEARMIERFRRQVEGERHVRIPAVCWELTARRVVTMDYLDGIKLSHREELERHEYDPKRIAKIMARVVFRQVFEHGLYHADPHPGNLMVMNGGIVAFLDYGIVGSLDATTREHVLDFVHALVRRDEERMIRVAMDAGQVPRDVDRHALRHRLREFLEQYAGVPLGQIRVAEVVTSFLEVLRDHHIHFPPNLLLLAKTIILLEGVARDLDPSFDVVREARPFVLRALRRRASPRRMASDVASAGLDYFRFLKRLPVRAGDLLDTLRHGEMEIGFRHEGLEDFGRELDRSTNRLAVAILVAASIIASGLVTLADVGPKIGAIPVLGFAGYIASGILGLWLIVAIIRSGRM